MTPPISLAAKTFGNLIFESTSGTWGRTFTGSNPLTVNGNFTLGTGVTLTIENTGTNVFKGNFVINGTLTNSTGTQVYNFAGTSEQQISGSATIVFETFQVNSAAIVKLLKDVSVASGFTATINGTLDLAEYSFSGAGNFTVSSGSTIKSGHINGLNSGITVSGSRSISTAANFNFYGTSSQETGTYLPTTINNLVVDNSASLQISNSNTIISGNLTINSGKKLEIGPGKLLTVSGTLTNNAGNSGLIIKSNSSGTGNLLHNTSSVPGTIERYVTGRTSSPYPYHFISSPISNANLGHIFQSGDYNVMWYDETNNDARLDRGWTKYAQVNMVSGRGYAIVSNYSNRTISYTGTLNKAPLTTAVTYTNTSPPYPYNLDPRGWNLVGNPFPCSLNISQFLSDNNSVLQTSAVYLWDDINGDTSRSGDYATHNGLGGVAASQNGSNVPNGIIGVGQGFFARVKPGTSTLSFTATQCVINTSSQFFLPEAFPASKLKFSLSDKAENYNEILIGFLNEATDSIDALYDAIKLKGNQYLSLYTVNNGNDYAIQGFPALTSSKDVLVGFNVAENGNYSFSLQSMENFSGNTSIILEDKLLNKFIDLVTQKEYDFSSTAGNITDRFILHFSLIPNSLKDEVSAQSIRIYSKEGKVYLCGNYDSENSIQLIDVQGKLLRSFKPSLIRNGIDLSEYHGIFLFKVFSGQKLTTQKVFLP